MTKDINLGLAEEVRVIALDFASKLVDYQAPVDVDALLANAARIETFIRKGADG
jgi:hypothetical protein